jgi:hypothetical protein
MLALALSTLTIGEIGVEASQEVEVDPLWATQCL